MMSLPGGSRPLCLVDSADPGAGLAVDPACPRRERIRAGVEQSGAFTIGVKSMPPRLEIVNVPPCMSSGLSLPSRAFAEIVPNSRDSSTMPLRPAPGTTWTTRPSGVSTAMPRL